MIFTPSPDPHANCRRFAEKIADMVKNGFPMGPEAVHYIESTFSNPSLEELGRILEDESNCETETLLELIFFPDEIFQIGLEEMLERFRFEEKDESIVAGYLAEYLPHSTVIRFPQTEATLAVRIPEAAAALLVSRLHITRNPDQKLVAAIQAFVEKECRQKFKVHYRNARTRLSDNGLLFLATFLEKNPADMTLALDCYDFLLAFLDGLQADDDLYRRLMASKRIYFQHLQKVHRSHEQLEKSNLETFIMQGNRLPYVDKQDVRKKIYLIDCISYAVFGKTEHYGSPSAEVDLGEFYDKQGLGTVFRMLS